MKKIYNFIKRLYIKLSNKQHYNLEPLKDSYEYIILPRFKGCNYGVLNPIECIYFSLIKIYDGDLGGLRIQGIRVRYPEEGNIIVDIYTSRPGFVIGFRGRDIDKLKNFLENYFGKSVIINLVEEKELNSVFAYIL